MAEEGRSGHLSEQTNPRFKCYRLRSAAAGTSSGITRWPSMAMRIVSFLALLFSALALVPYGAHLFALPNKIGMTQEHYFIAQDAYRGWAWLGVILFPAMVLNIALAILLRGQRPASALAVTGCLLMVTTLAVFFAWTYPANVATQNWTAVPANWAALRRQWEYSHAANAALNIVAFGCIAAAVIARRD
jgi:hypothetical protein